MKSQQYQENLRFDSAIVYRDRAAKAEYVYDKYRPLLVNRVLDVGADAMHLKPLVVQGGGDYTGIGYGDDIDLTYDLETGTLPFSDQSFDTVLCLDVLEHLESIHSIFDELCRVAKNNVVISLPNPWADFFSVLRRGDYSEQESIKFYGLTVEPPKDRHRWFFNEREAKRFVIERGQRQQFSLLQYDTYSSGEPMGGNRLKGILGRFLLRKIFRNDIAQIGLHHGTQWFVLQRDHMSGTVN